MYIRKLLLLLLPAFVACNTHTATSTSADSTTAPVADSARKDTAVQPLAVAPGETDNYEALTDSNKICDLRKGEILIVDKLYDDTVKFILHEDRSDDWYMLVQKGPDTVNLLFNEMVSGLAQNDSIIARWKIDTFSPSGDEHYLIYRPVLTDWKKVTQ